MQKAHFISFSPSLSLFLTLAHSHSPAALQLDGRQRASMLATCDVLGYPVSTYVHVYRYHVPVHVHKVPVLLQFSTF